MPFLLLVAGALGFLVYKNSLSSASGQTVVSPGSSPNTASGAQTQAVATYPYQAPVSQRADTSNQPWYGQARAPAIGDNALITAQQIASLWPTGSSIVQSMGDLFGTDNSNDPSNLFYGNPNDYSMGIAQYADNGDDYMIDVGTSPDDFSTIDQGGPGSSAYLDA